MSHDSTRIYPPSTLGKLLAVAFCALLLAGCGASLSSSPVTGLDQTSSIDQDIQTNDSETEPSAQPQAVVADPAESSDSPRPANVAASTAQDTAQTPAKSTRTSSTRLARWNACASDDAQNASASGQNTSGADSVQYIEPKPLPPIAGIPFVVQYELPNGDVLHIDGTIVQKDGTVIHGATYKVHEDGTFTVYYNDESHHLVEIYPSGNWSEAEWFEEYPFDQHHWDFLIMSDLGTLRADGAVLDEHGDFVGRATFEDNGDSITVTLPDGTIWSHDRATDVRRTEYPDGVIRTEYPDGITDYFQPAPPVLPVIGPIDDPVPVPDPAPEDYPVPSDKKSADEQDTAEQGAESDTDLDAATNLDAATEQDGIVVIALDSDSVGEQNSEAVAQDSESAATQASELAAGQGTETIAAPSSAPLVATNSDALSEQLSETVEANASSFAEPTPTPVESVSESAPEPVSESAPEPVSEPAPEPDAQTATTLDSDPVEAQAIDSVVEQGSVQ